MRRTLLFVLFLFLCAFAPLLATSTAQTLIPEPVWRDDGGTDVVISPDGRFLAARYWEFVRLLDTATGKEVRRIRHGADSSIDLLFSADSTQVTIADRTNGSVTVWEVALGRKLHRMGSRYRGGDDRRVRLGAGGRLLAIAQKRPARRTLFGEKPPGKADAVVWDVWSGKRLAHVVEDGAYIDGMEFTPDGKYLLTKTAFSPGKLWEVSSGRVVRTFRISPVFAFSPDGRYLAVSGVGIVEILDVSTGEPVRRLEMSPRPRDAHPPQALAYSADGRFVAAGELGIVDVFEAHTARRIATLGEREAKLIWSVAFTPDGQALASGGQRGLELWDLRPALGGP